MTIISKQIDYVYQLYLLAELTKEGFRVSGRNFRKQVADSIHIVSVQGGRNNNVLGPHAGSFTMVAGLYIPALSKIHMYEPNKKKPSVHECYLSEALKCGKSWDYKWEIGHSTDIDQLAHELLDTWHIYGKQWFLEFSDPKNIIEYFIHRRHFPMAAASYNLMLGNVDQATQIAQKTYNESASIQPFIINWASRNHIKLNTAA